MSPGHASPTSRAESRARSATVDGMNKAPIAVCLATGALLLPGCESFELHSRIIDRSATMATAMQQKDMETLERVMAPDFRLTLEEIPPFALTVDQGNPAPGLPGWQWRENLQGMSFGRITMSSIDTVQLADDLMAMNMRMTLEEWTTTDERGTGACWHHHAFISAALHFLAIYNYAYKCVKTFISMITTTHT